MATTCFRFAPTSPSALTLVLTIARLADSRRSRITTSS